MKRLVLSVALLLLTSCVTYPPVQIPGVRTYSEGEYQRIFNENTQEEQKYSGLTNTMTIKVTPITPRLADAILSRKAQIYQWSEEQYNQARSEMQAALSRETQFFVSLYTPTARMEDMSRKKDLWNLFLDQRGQRFKGEPQKIMGEFEELSPIYPSHDRFSTAYLVTFPVASEENMSGAEFLITGPVDSASLKF